MGIAFFGALSAYVGFFLHRMLDVVIIQPEALSNTQQVRGIIYLLLFPILNFFYIQLTVNSMLVVWRIRGYLLALEKRLTSICAEPVLGWQSYMRGGKEMEPGALRHSVGFSQGLLYVCSIVVSFACCAWGTYRVSFIQSWPIILLTIGCWTLTILTFFNIILVGIVARQTMIDYRRRWVSTWHKRFDLLSEKIVQSKNDG